MAETHFDWLRLLDDHLIEGVHLRVSLPGLNIDIAKLVLDPGLDIFL